jgi:hypothetical protein
MIGKIGRLFLSLAVRTAVELFTGATLFVNCVAAGFTPVPQARVVGALTGAAIRPIPSDDLDAFGVSRRDHQASRSHVSSFLPGPATFGFRRNED